jgi:adenosylcobinamide-phosphate synthase
LIILLALLVDHWWGEPPPALHPVVWMGHFLNRAGRGLPEQPPKRAFCLGMIWWLLGAALVASVFIGADRLLVRLPVWLHVLLAALLLKPLLALRLLLQEVRSVEEALGQNLAAGRERLSRIVSRDTTALDEAQVRESALESLSENLSDSVVAPLFWYALLGLPGAAVYRFANTADAMWGYRGRWEWAGKFAARSDDVLNWVPARLTALALLLAGPSRARPLRRLPREAAHTASPNSGWPMAALALALSVQMRKPHTYTLNGSAPSPDRSHTPIALKITQRAAWTLALLIAAALTAITLLHTAGSAYV